MRTENWSIALTVCKCCGSQLCDWSDRRRKTPEQVPEHVPRNLGAEKNQQEADSQLFGHTLKVFRSPLLALSGDSCCRASLSTPWWHLSSHGLIWPVLDVSCAPIPLPKGWCVMFTSAHALVSSIYPWPSSPSIDSEEHTRLGPLCDVLSPCYRVCHHRRTGQSPSAHKCNRTSFVFWPPLQSGTSVTWIKKLATVAWTTST